MPVSGRRIVSISILVAVLLFFAPRVTVASDPATSSPSTRVTSQAPRMADVPWDISSNGLFDKTNKDFPYENGIATVDLRSGRAPCPTGLGSLTSDRNVRELHLKFRSPASADYCLHVQWDPGGSGREQFEVRMDGTSIGRSRLVEAGERPYEEVQDRFQVHVSEGEAELTLRYLSGDGLRFRNIVLNSGQEPPAPLNPELEFPTLADYGNEIKEPAIMLDSTHVRLFAPKTRQQEAQVIFGYLVKAYDELYQVIGIHTRFRIVVYHFPETSPSFSGGTSNCTIRYGYRNLDLAGDPEWKTYRVPHVSGYIEEMAHNFVDASGVQFGWEMVGWIVGSKTSLAVAPNPLLRQALQSTRAGQAMTFQRYVGGGYVFPKDLPGNQCDRIHAELLWQSEQKYGPTFWQDFFSEVRRRHAELARAKDRDERYRISVECFDSLKSLHFKEMLKKDRISTTTDIKSLNPESPVWDRTYLAPGEKP